MFFLFFLKNGRVHLMHLPHDTRKLIKKKKIKLVPVITDDKDIDYVE